MADKSAYAVITGASSGIGREFARLLADEGYSVVLVARRRERLEETAREIGEKFGDPERCRIITADLSRESEVLRVCDEISALNTEVFINNAGFGDAGSFPDTEMSKELLMIDVNVRAVHMFTKKMSALFRQKGRGYLLNVASSAGLFPAGPYMATYYATKAYVTSLSRAVAAELKDEHSGVYVGCLCPGPVNTEFDSVANVEFSLNGISPAECAEYALSQMKRKKTVIIPTFRMRAAVFGQRFIPGNTIINIVGSQQKKKRSS